MSCSWHQNLTDVIPPADGSSSGTHQGQWSKANVWGRVQKWNKNIIILFQILSQKPAIWGSVWETTWVGMLSHSPCESSMTRGPESVCTQTHTVWEQRRRVSSPCSCRPVTSLGLQRHGGIAHRTGVEHCSKRIQAFQERQAAKARRRGCTLCKGVARVHGDLPWNRWRVTWDLMAMNQRTDEHR